MKRAVIDVLNGWSPELELTVKAKFIKRGTDAPLHGGQYTVRLYDRDIFTDDDYLGSSRLNEKGEATINFFPTDIKNFDLGFEELPDLYLLLFKGDVVHFQTQVWDNVDFEKLALMDLREGKVLHFGTFLVD